MMQSNQLSRGTCHNVRLPSTAQRCYVKPFQRPQQRQSKRRQVLRRAEDEEGFQDKIKRLKDAQKKDDQASGERGQKESPQKGTKTKKKVDYDFTGEQLHFEGPPHRGDLATNVALGATLLWLPLTFAAVGRAAFIKYRITDKRISVITDAPWKKERLDAAYQEVSDVQTVGRGVGLWGDMVVTLRNNNKIEMRSLPNFLDLKKYILERKDALASVSGKEESTSVEKIKPKGFGGKN